MTVSDSLVRIGDLLEVDGLSYGIVQPGSDTPGGVPMLRVSDLEVGATPDHVMRVDPDIETKFRRTRLKGGELLLTVVGSPGLARVATTDLAGYNVARAIAVLRFREVEPQWVALAFETPTVRHQLASLLNTTVQATLNLADVRNILIPVPKTILRGGILKVLGSLEDKFAANRRILAASDEIIRSLYEQLELSSSVVLGDLVSNPRQQVDVGEIGADEYYLGLEHFDYRTLWLSRCGWGSVVTSTKSAFQPGDTLFGRLRPYFHKVAIPDRGGVCSTDILVLRAKRSEWRWLAAAAASSDAVVAYAVQNSNGTKMPRAKWNDISNLPVPDPNTNQSREFSQVAGAVIERTWSAIQENERLVSTRAELLPLLMSGEITVKHTETRIEQEA